MVGRARRALTRLRVAARPTAPSCPFSQAQTIARAHVMDDAFSREPDAPERTAIEEEIISIARTRRFRPEPPCAASRISFRLVRVHSDNPVVRRNSPRPGRARPARQDTDQPAWVKRKPRMRHGNPAPRRARSRTASRSAARDAGFATVHATNKACMNLHRGDPEAFRDRILPWNGRGVDAGTMARRRVGRSERRAGLRQSNTALPGGVGGHEPSTTLGGESDGVGRPAGCPRL